LAPGFTDLIAGAEIETSFAYREGETGEAK